MSTQIEYEVQCCDYTSEHIKHGWDHMSTQGTLADARKYLKDSLTKYPPEPGEKFRIVKVVRTETRKVVK